MILSILKLIQGVLSLFFGCNCNRDLIVGLSGDPDTDFKKSFDYISNIHTSYLFAFHYLAHANNSAAPVPVQIIISRYEHMRKLSAKKMLNFCGHLVFDEREVLFEANNSQYQWTGLIYWRQKRACV